MAKLVVNPTSPSRREVALSRTLVSIGRDPSNDVVLPDAMVSRRHAVIEYRGSQYYLRDCNSSNGSLINGDRVSERGLRDGDLVAIGTARLLFRDDLVAEDAAGKVIHHPSAPRQQCPSCQHDYRKGDLFCRHCGSSLAPHAATRTICSACGTAVPLPARFCTACGTRLGEPEEVEEPGHEDEPGVEARAAPELDEPPASPEAAGEAEASVERDVEPEAEPPEEPSGASAEKPPDEPPDEPAQEPARAPFPRASTADEVPLPPLRPPAGLRTEPLPPQSSLPAPAPMTAAQPAVRAAPFLHLEPQLEEKTGEVRLDARPTTLIEPSLGPLLVAPAGALPRLGAFLVDLVIVAAGQSVLGLPSMLYWMNSAQPASASDPPADVPFLPIFLSVAMAALAAILGAVYYVYFWGVKAATPGKQLFGLVVQTQGGRQPIGPGRAALRLIGYGVSGLVFGIGFLMIAFGGSGLHDQIAGTRVMRRKGA